MKGTVLIVEDEPNHRAVARMTLRLAGYRVCDASSGEEAMAILDELRPDALILDIRLPGMDGLTVLDQIRSHQGMQRVPVVLCSAHTTTMPDAHLRDPWTGFVAKPFHPDLLVAELDDLLTASNRESSP